MEGDIGAGWRRGTSRPARRPSRRGDRDRRPTDAGHALATRPAARRRRSGDIPATAARHPRAGPAHVVTRCDADTAPDRSTPSPHRHRRDHGRRAGTAHGTPDRLRPGSPTRRHRTTAHPGPDTPAPLRATGPAHRDRTAALILLSARHRPTARRPRGRSSPPPRRPAGRAPPPRSWRTAAPRPRQDRSRRPRTRLRAGRGRAGTRQRRSSGRTVRGAGTATDRGPDGAATRAGRSRVAVEPGAEVLQRGVRTATFRPP